MTQQNLASVDNTVVVVEDDDLLRSLMVEAIKDLGFGVVDFSTADDALIYVMQATVKVILVVADLTIPGQLDGIELAEMLDVRYPDIPFILTTGYIDVTRGLSKKVKFLPKPWSIIELSSLVSKALSKS